MVLISFVQLVRAAFQFLHTEFGFSEVSSDVTFLRYQTDTVFVNVYYGRSSHEVRYEIGLLRTPERLYQPEDVGALIGSTEETYFQASTAERLVRYVPRLADLLRNQAGKLLAGDQQEFARLDEVARRKAKALTRRYRLYDLREDLDQAWKRHDYRALIEILNAIGPDMTQSEQWKLQYALKKVEPIN